MNSLVGYTGFVGSNIVVKANFQGLYNSKNIDDAFNTCPELLVFAGIRAEKFLANNEPQKDYAIVREAFKNIQKINPKKLILISTVDVYKNPANVDEDTPIETNGLQAYGLNRYHLEQMVEHSGINALIVRLPGLYGKNIKKNFIYDMINIIPSMLTEKKYFELCFKNDLVKNYYIKQDNGFFKCKEVSKQERLVLKKYFSEVGFSALNFTDSRAQFQFYNLNFLWTHINIALKNNIRKLNLATEPVLISDLFRYITGSDFTNEVTDIIPKYDFKTKYSDLYAGENGYLFNKCTIMEDIKQFIDNYLNND